MDIEHSQGSAPAEPGRDRRAGEVAARPMQPGEHGRPAWVTAAGERRAGPAIPAVPADPGGHRRVLLLGTAAAVGTAIVTTVLAGALDVTLGLIPLAAFTGWLVGAVVRATSPGALAPRARVGLAVGLAVASVVLAAAGTWAMARWQGGVLGPVDFLWQTYGLLPLLEVGAAAIVAAWSAR